MIVVTSMTEAVPAVPDQGTTYLLTHHDGHGWLCQTVEVGTANLELYGQTTVRLLDQVIPEGPTGPVRRWSTPGYDPDLKVEARERVDALCKALRVTHPERILDQAANLLTGLWTVGRVHGIEPQDWRAYTNLLGGSLDAAILADARANNGRAGRDGWSLGKY